MQPCLICGAPVKLENSKFCSRACADSARRKPKGTCPVCGKVVARRGSTYCSRECLKSTTLPTHGCKRCGGAVRWRSYKYCSQECSRQDQKQKLLPRPMCIQCGVNPCPTRKRRTCSLECYEAFARKTVNPLYTPEFVARCIQLCVLERQSTREVASRMGITQGSLKTLLSKNGHPRLPPPEGRRQPSNGRLSPQVLEAIGRDGRGVRFKPKGGLAPHPSGRPPIPIPLREVYRWGLDLGVPLEDRDIVTVSRAMRAVDPTHPGFVLKDRW